MLGGWRRRAHELRRDVIALYLACRDPRVPWYAKACAALLVAYALSPIDLIPDFIPVLGYLDELILLPLGVLLVLKMIPGGILAEHRQREGGDAAAHESDGRGAHHRGLARPDRGGGGPGNALAGFAMTPWAAVRRRVAVRRPYLA
jgi:uncharacterized membrane protein YkvA (DUF1232 family)